MKTMLVVCRIERIIAISIVALFLLPPMQVQPIQIANEKPQPSVDKTRNLPSGWKGVSGLWWANGDEICGRYQPVDLNNDGYPDIVFSNAYNGSSRNINSTIYWGSKDGYSLSNKMELPTSGARGNILADFDDDGLYDIVVANYEDDSGGNTETSWIYYNSAAGFSSSNTQGVTTYGGFAPSVADFNADGFKDLFISEGASKTSDMWLDYYGIFHYLSLSSNTATDSLVADFNNDGRLDILICNSNDGTTYNTDSYLYYQNSDDLKFDHKISIPTKGAYGCSAEDLNNDGYLDLVFSNFWNGNYNINSFIYYGSSGGFSTDNRTELPTMGASSNSIADLNNDGYPDIVFCSYYDEKTYDQDSYIYWGSAKGYSSSDRTGIPTCGAMGCAIGDLNNDSYLELVFSCHQNDMSLNINSIIYWGSQDGYSSLNTTELPTSGAYGVVVSDFRLPSGNMAYGSEPSYPPSIAICDNNSNTSYTYGSTVKFENNPGYVDVEGGIIFGLDETNGSYYYAVLNPHRDTIELFRHWANRTARMGFSNNTIIEPDTPYDLIADIHDTNVKVYLNDTLYFNITDSNLSAGKYGLYSSLGEVHFIPSMCPDPPSNLSVINETADHVTNHHPTLGWTFKDPDSGDFQNQYRVDIFADDEMTLLWDTASITSLSASYIYGSSNYQDNSLLDGKTYYWRVMVRDNHGIWGNWSDPASFRMNTPPDFPTVTAPQDNKTVNVTNLIFRWNRSNDAEGDNVTYRIEVQISTADWTTPVAIINATRTCATSTVLLSDKTTYKWRIYASDGFEYGNNSPEWHFMMDYYAKAPSEPLSLSYKITGDKIDLSWNPPAQDGGYPVLSYMVYRGDSENNLNIVNVTDNTGFIDTDAILGTTYYYAVSALNAIDEGRISQPVKIPMGYVPEMPVNVTGIFQNNQVNLAWEKPVRNGYFPIGTYKIYKGENEQAISTINTTANLSYSDSEITIGKIFYYKISAVNEVGEGNLSISIFVRIGYVPSAPQNLTAKVGKASIQLSWTIPENDGGFPVTSYTIFRGETPSDIQILNESNQTNYIDMAVTLGTKYLYLITAVNVVDSGNASERISVIMGYPPSLPANLTVEWLNGKVKLAWNHPIDNGGFPVLKYHLYRGLTEDTVSRIAEISATDYTDINVSNDLKYFYKVTAVNILGESEPAMTSGTPRKVASAVLNLKENVEGRIVSMTWDEPVDKGGSEILYYNVYREEMGVKILLGRTEIRSYSDINLSAGIFKYTVTAVTANGEGELSAEVLIYIRNQLPTADFIVKPRLIGGLSTTFIFYSRSNDSDGSIISVDWKFGDNMNGSGTVVKHQFQSFGAFVVRLTVTDNDHESTSATLTITIDPSFVDHPPKIIRARPEDRSFDMGIGSTVKLQISAEDEDGDELTYSWHINGREIANNNSDTFFFTGKSEGNYQILLIVSDGSLNVSREYHISVKEKQTGMNLLPMVLLVLILCIVSSTGGYIYIKHGKAKYSSSQETNKIISDLEPITDQNTEKEKIKSDIQSDYISVTSERGTMPIKSDEPPVIEYVNVSKPEKAMITPSRSNTEIAAKEIPPDIPGSSQIITNPFRDEGEALSSLSIVLKGLPASLSAMDMEELAKTLSVSRFMETPDGELIVEIRGNWYYGDKKQQDTYLQIFHK
jgi:fibronectin type 3 domain-containing protein